MAKYHYTYLITNLSPFEKININEFTTREESINKLKEQYKNLDWKATKGKQKINKFRIVISDPVWSSTTGKRLQQKRARTISDVTWQRTVLKDQKRKEKETKSSDKWIAQHTVKSEHCKLETINPGPFQR